MKQQTPTSLAFDLLVTDLSSIDELTDLVVRHTVAPAREAWGLAAPVVGEGDAFLFEEAQDGLGGIPMRSMKPHRLSESKAHFVPVLRGLLLFAWLFPESVSPAGRVPTILDEPGWSFIDDSYGLMFRPYDAMREMVRALLGHADARINQYTGMTPLRPEPNPAAMQALENARELVARAVGPIPDEADTYVLDRGLDRMEWWAAHDVDKILHRHVHRRLVRLESPEIPFNDTARTIYMDRGVFGADIPETLEALVALDLSEQLGQGRRVGICARCRRPLQLTDRQEGRAKRGQPVYHENCWAEQRLDYWRGKARARYERTKAPKKSLSVPITEPQH
jgi:hypothetical protein